MLTLLATISLSLSCAHAELTSNSLGQLQNLTELPSSVLVDVPPACAGATSSCPVLYFIPPGSNAALFFLPTPAYLYSRIKGFISVMTSGIEVADFTDEPSALLSYFSSMYTALRNMGAVGRVYVFGRSSGGLMAHVLAIGAGSSEDALPVKGIAVNGAPLQFPAGLVSYEFMPHLETPKIAQQSIHCDADHKIPIDGGVMAASDDGVEDDIYLSEHGSNRAWKHHNECDGSLHKEEIAAQYRMAPAKLEDTLAPGEKVDVDAIEPTNTTAQYYVWEGCPDATPVEYVIIHGCDHGEQWSVNGSSYEIFAIDFLLKVEESNSAAVASI